MRSYRMSSGMMAIKFEICFGNAQLQFSDMASKKLDICFGNTQLHF